jgi:hypothetical protein
MKNRALMIGVLMALALIAAVSVVGFLYFRGDKVDITLETYCKDQGATVEVLRLFLSEGSKQFEQRPVNARNRDDLKRFAENAERLLDAADCPPGDPNTPGR